MPFRRRTSVLDYKSDQIKIRETDRKEVDYYPDALASITLVTPMFSCDLSIWLAGIVPSSREYSIATGTSQLLVFRRQLRPEQQD